MPLQVNSNYRIPIASLIDWKPERSWSGPISELGKKALKWKDGIKNDWPGFIEMAALSMYRHREKYNFYMEDDSILVPVPSSAKITADTSSIPQRICEELHKAGFGSQIAKLLERTVTIRRSSHSGGNRPDLDEQYDTMGYCPEMLNSKNITLIDDVVTKGNTIYSAACRIQEAVPGATVRAFVLLRTCSFDPDLASMPNPKLGQLIQCSTVPNARWEEDQESGQLDLL